jgi:hypothetical protein
MDYMEIETTGSETNVNIWRYDVVVSETKPR